MKRYCFVDCRQIPNYDYFTTTPAFTHVFIEADGLNEAYRVGDAALPAEWREARNKYGDGLNSYAFEVPEREKS